MLFQEVLQVAQDPFFLGKRDGPIFSALQFRTPGSVFHNKIPGDTGKPAGSSSTKAVIVVVKAISDEILIERPDVFDHLVTDPNADKADRRISAEGNDLIPFLVPRLVGALHRLSDTSIDTRSHNPEFGNLGGQGGQFEEAIRLRHHTIIVDENRVAMTRDSGFDSHVDVSSKNELRKYRGKGEDIWPEVPGMAVSHHDNAWHPGMRSPNRFYEFDGQLGIVVWDNNGERIHTRGTFGCRILPRLRTVFIERFMALGTRGSLGLDGTLGSKCEIPKCVGVPGRRREGLRIISPA